MRSVFTCLVLMSAMRAQSAPPAPRPYKIATMDYMTMSVRGLNQRGDVYGMGNGYEPAKSTVVRWTPFVPNGGAGTQIKLDGPFNNQIGVVANDAGRVAYANRDTFVLSIWTPDGPGSSTGQSVDVTAPRSVHTLPYGINSFGQVTIDSYNQGTALWTPDTANGSTGSLRVFGYALGAIQHLGLNDFGQVLYASPQSNDHRFFLYQPIAANSGTGSLVTVEKPAESAYVQPMGLNARGDVAGEVCIQAPGSACQPRGFFWRPSTDNGTTGAYTVVPPPAGYVALKFTGLNNRGEAVGILTRDSVTTTAIVYTGGTIYELPTTIKPFVLTINDAGQILMYPWSGAMLLMTPYTMPAPDANAVSVTITDSTSTNLPFTVTGTGCQAGSYPTPQVLRWTPGASCTVGWVTPQNLGVVHRRSFGGWADGVADNPRTFLAPAAPTTLRAVFREELIVGASAYPPELGTVSCPQWAVLGDLVTCTATERAGGRFRKWSSTGSNNPTISFVLKEPANFSMMAVALFTRIGPIPTNYGITVLPGVPAMGTALNNYGQILHKSANPIELRVWTPSQPNGTSGASTALNGMTVAGTFVGRSSINDRGAVAADTTISPGPLRLWSPSSPNGSSGTYHTIATSGRLRGMNNYGQVAGNFSGVGGLWTPAAADGTTGSVMTDLKFGTIDALGPAGQTVSANPSAYSQFDVFTPMAPNLGAGGFNSLELVYYTYTRLGQFSPRGELPFSNCGIGGIMGGCEWKPQIWRPAEAGTLAGSMEDLPYLDGFYGFHPQFMNARGEILGVMQTANRFATPFLISNGKMYDVGAMPGVPELVQLAGLNDAGQILLSVSTTVSEMLLLTPPQPATCMVQAVPYVLTIGPNAGRTRVTVRADSSCGWTASSGASWLSVVNSSGQGTKTLHLDVLRNDTGSPREAIVTINGYELLARQATLPVVTFTPPVLRFRASGGSVSAPIDVQFLVNGAGTVDLGSPQGSLPITMSPVGGPLPGSVKFSLLPGASSLWRTSGAINLNLLGAGQSTISVPYVIDQYPAPSGVTPPFGNFDTPSDYATGITGSIAITGWALDNFGMKSVTIWRDPIGPELVQSNGYVYIGDALFVRGARPDVQVKFPTYPDSDRAGWGYMMLTYGLPAKGNGTYRIHAIATDLEGNQVKLGTRTISVDNARASKPFGAIDAPAPGEVVSGTIYNAGWALTPQPASIAANGSTIWVNIDGVNAGNPVFGFARGDVGSYLPGYANSKAAGGQYALNSTLYPDGMHAIAWVIYDSLGRIDGMGSRYFYIQNGSTGTSEEREPEAERELQLRTARVRRTAAPVGGYPAFRRGYDLEGELTPIRRGGEGLLEPVELKELDRVEIHLPGGLQEAAGLRVGDELRELPVGSTFDAEGGIFYWQLGAGFLGQYLLEFRASDGTVVVVPVRVGELSQGSGSQER